MTSIRAEIRQSTPAHAAVTVWAGPDAEHRAHCGTLTMRPDEAAELIARIDAGEPAACPVASEPVELAVELARELACCGPDDGPTDGWIVVANEYVESRRWESVHRLVIRNEQGEHFMDTYRQGLTERQDYGPYEYESTATFTPVVPHAKVVTEWKSAPKGGRS